MKISAFTGIIIIILVVGVPLYLRIIKLKKLNTEQKIRQAEMEQKMGRFDYIIQEKNKLKQQVKLVPALFIIGIVLLVAGIALNMTGWRGAGIGQAILFGIISIISAICMKGACSKKITEYEQEIKDLKEGKKNE